MTRLAPGGGAPTVEPQNPLHRLTPEQIDEIGEEFQKIHDEVYADLGNRDADYIKSIVQFHRRLVVLSRIVLMASRYWPAWVLGTTGLSVAKILENMEIGHNVMHGQWDWMNDPVIHSSVWDWDTASPASAWKHSHNYIHHTFTNIVGKDKDVGYEIMRVDPKQEWNPVYLFQPFYNILLALFFEWGVAVHDLDFEAIRKGEKPMSQVKDELKAIGIKGRKQIVKDYIVFPALSGKEWKKTLYANLVANFVRNVWSYAIIFCGHFPDQTYTFEQDEVEDETKGGWFVRQLIGAANIEGGPTFHIMSGNLGYQVEHHLYPDMPSSRYGEIAPRVREICHRYGLPYNSGPFSKQFGSVQRTLLRLAFPGGKERKKAPPYPGDLPDEVATNGSAPSRPGELAPFP